MTKVMLNPMPGKVIVKTFDNDRTDAGLFLISSSRQSQGRIVAVYDDFVDPDTDAEVSAFLSVGDTVIYGQHSGSEVTINREKFIILVEREILCKVTFHEEEET